METCHHLLRHLDVAGPDAAGDGFQDLRIAVEPAELACQCIQVFGRCGVYQLLEARHVVGHGQHDRHVVLAGAEKLLHPGVDLGGGPNLAGGQGHEASPSAGCAS